LCRETNRTRRLVQFDGPLDRPRLSRESPLTEGKYRYIVTLTKTFGGPFW
jgi:hypothetical protein